MVYLLLLKIQIYNEDRYEDINIFLGTRYFVLLDANLGAQQAHDTSVHIVFPALPGAGKFKLQKDSFVLDIT